MIVAGPSVISATFEVDKIWKTAEHPEPQDVKKRTLYCVTPTPAHSQGAKAIRWRRKVVDFCVAFIFRPNVDKEKSPAQKQFAHATKNPRNIEK